MLACRSEVPLILMSLLSACAGLGEDRVSPQASADAALAETSAAWGCYEPQPGHPTEAEKRAFVEEVATLATRAEERHGVPATAITAMAILESGYGWTRLAQNTNNLLGWKYSPRLQASASSGCSNARSRGSATGCWCSATAPRR